MRDSSTFREKAPKQGDLAWILDGPRSKLCIVIEVYGSIYNANLRDWKYLVLVENKLLELRGWRIEKFYDDINL